jgi:hypothetical protein
VITLNTRLNGDGLDLEDTSFDEIQFIVASGEHEETLKAGAKVLLDVAGMMKYDQAQSDAYEKIGYVQFTPVEVDGQVYGLVSDRHIMALDGR